MMNAKRLAILRLEYPRSFKSIILPRSSQWGVQNKIQNNLLHEYIQSKKQKNREIRMVDKVEFSSTNLIQVKFLSFKIVSNLNFIKINEKFKSLKK